MGMPVERTDVDVAPHFTQLQLRFVDQLQWRYELIRPLVLFEDRPAPQPAIRQRAHETATHPETVRKLTRRFEQQGLLGLVPDDVKVVPKDKAPVSPPPGARGLPRLQHSTPGFSIANWRGLSFTRPATRIPPKPSNRPC